MTSHAARLYALALAVLVFFLSWAVFAARPWAAEAQDSRLVALAKREQRVRAQTLAVRKVVARRWAVYRRALADRRSAIAAIEASNARVRSAQLAASLPAFSATPALPASAPVAPSTPPAAPAPAPVPAPAVRVVTLPPVTITRTS